MQQLLEEWSSSFHREQKINTRREVAREKGREAEGEADEEKNENERNEEDQEEEERKEGGGVRRKKNGISNHWGQNFLFTVTTH